MTHRSEPKYHSFLPPSLREFWAYQWHGHWTRAAFPAHFLGGVAGVLAVALWLWLPVPVPIKATVAGLIWWELRNKEIWNSTAGWKMVSDVVAGTLGAVIVWEILCLM